MLFPGQQGTVSGAKRLADSCRTALGVFFFYPTNGSRSPGCVRSRTPLPTGLAPRVRACWDLGREVGGDSQAELMSATGMGGGGQRWSKSEVREPSVSSRGRPPRRACDFRMALGGSLQGLQAPSAVTGMPRQRRQPHATHQRHLLPRR